MRLYVTIWMLLFATMAQASDTLTFAMSDALEMPFINQANARANPSNYGKHLPGILAEWNIALAKQLGKKSEFGVYPSKRIVRVMEVAQQMLCVMCFRNGCQKSWQLNSSGHRLS